MPHRSPIKRIGRRGLFLIFYGLIWLLYGLAFLLIPFNSRFTRDDGNKAVYNVVLAFFDKSWVGWMWVVCGISAVIFGLLRSRISLLSWDHYGFNMILTPPICWAFIFVWSAAVAIFTHGSLGSPTAPVGALIWGLLTGSILIVSGWPDPSDLPPAQVLERAGEPL